VRNALAVWVVIDSRDLQLKQILAPRYRHRSMPVKNVFLNQ